MDKSHYFYVLYLGELHNRRMFQLKHTVNSLFSIAISDYAKTLETFFHTYDCTLIHM